MQDLTVIGIENGALLVSSENGERYRVAIDEVLQSRLRQSTSTSTPGVKVSPREIQSQIRAGMSAEDVARATGASLEYVERFEGPVLAERLHIVSSALRVPVKVAASSDPLRSDPLAADQSSTFGEIIEERLEGLGATDLRWASWKEESGWIVKLTFTASEIDHDARWQYDAKRHSLTPLNSGAVTLSQHGEISDGLIPRLRAVDLNGFETAAATPSIPRAEVAGLGIDDLDAAFPASGSASDSGSTSSPGGDGLASPDRSAEVPAIDDGSSLGDGASAVSQDASGRYAPAAHGSIAASAASSSSAPATAAGRGRAEGKPTRSLWGSVGRASRDTGKNDAGKNDTEKSGAEKDGAAKNGAAPEQPYAERREPGRGPTAPPVIVEPTPFARPAARTEQESSARAAAAAVNRAATPTATHNETADLLEALRRRRGERESASFLDDGDDLDSYDDSRSSHPAHGGMFVRGSSGLSAAERFGDARPVAHLNAVADRQAAEPGASDASNAADEPAAVDVPLSGLETDVPDPGKRQAAAQPRKKNRAAMPSWDEIVFGARSDDDLS